MLIRSKWRHGCQVFQISVLVHCCGAGIVGREGNSSFTIFIWTMYISYSNINALSFEPIGWSETNYWKCAICWTTCKENSLENVASVYQDFLLICLPNWANLSPTKITINYKLTSYFNSRYHQTCTIHFSIFTHYTTLMTSPAHSC